MAPTRHTSGYSHESAYVNRYSEYLYSDYAEIVIRSTGSRTGKGLVLIGNSYSSCIERLFLSAYDVVHVVDPRQAAFDLSPCLQDKPEVFDARTFRAPIRRRAR